MYDGLVPEDSKACEPDKYRTVVITRSYVPGLRHTFNTSQDTGGERSGTVCRQPEGFKDGNPSRREAWHHVSIRMKSSHC
jgi:hypothetical protein